VKTVILREPAKTAALGLTRDCARDSVDAGHRRAVHSPPTVLARCEILLSPLNYSRYRCICLSMGPRSGGSGENSMPRSMHDEWLNMQNGAWRTKRNAIRSRGSRAACFVVATHGMPKLLHVININALHAHQRKAKRGRGRDGTHRARSMRCYCVRCAHLQRDCVHTVDILRGEFFNKVYFIFAVRESAVYAADRIAGSRLHATCITL